MTNLVIIVRVSKSNAFMDSRTCMLPTYYTHAHTIATSISYISI